MQFRRIGCGGQGLPQAFFRSLRFPFGLKAIALSEHVLVVADSGRRLFVRMFPAGRAIRVRTRDAHPISFSRRRLPAAEDLANEIVKQ